MNTTHIRESNSKKLLAPNFGKRELVFFIILKFGMLHHHSKYNDKDGRCQHQNQTSPV
jgi:hypothetical protein